MSSSGHTMKVTVDPMGNLGMELCCGEPDDAPCRDDGECQAELFVNADHPGECYGGSETVQLCDPIAVTLQWEGEYYTWEKAQ